MRVPLGYDIIWRFLQRCLMFMGRGGGMGARGGEAFQEHLELSP